MKRVIIVAVLCLGFSGFATAEQIDQSRDAVVAKIVEFSAQQIDPAGFADVVTVTGERVYRYVGPQGAEVTLYGPTEKVSHVELLVNLQKQDIRRSLTLITTSAASMTRSVDLAKWIITALDQLQAEGGGIREKTMQGRKIKVTYVPPKALQVVIHPKS